MKTKKCSKCGIYKSLKEFSKDKSNKDALCCSCKSCRAKYTNEYDLTRRYGITLEQKRKMVEEQDGKCAICEKELNKGRDINVDHCHNKNKIRGILCNNCNRGIGLFKDNPEIIRAAINYIEKHKDE